MQLVAGAGIAADIHPIGSRVRLTLTGAHGTVRAWGYAAPHYHVVDLDDGMRVAVAGAGLERATARRDWAEHAIVVEAWRTAP